MFIDTHCHLSFEYYNSIEDVILENRKNKIDKIIISGCSKEEIESSLQYIESYEDVYATIGYHPDQVEQVGLEDIQKLESLIMEHKKIVGIGEIGLDYHYTKENKEKQIALFKSQLDLAEKLHLPVVIHTRDATEDTINILREYKLNGVIHCFSGSLETANIYLSLGYKLGIGGVVTFKNSKLGEVVKKVSLSAIVLETDSPYLSPEPFRGTTNSSKNIPLIAMKISQIKGVNIEEVSKITLENTYNLFDLK